MLDTRSGTRAARAVERIAYSTAWNGGASVRVAVDGVTLFEAEAPASGVVFWNAAAAGGGVYTLTHESGDVTLTALFTVAAAPVLEVESADWSAGSITLRCTDGGASGAGNKYTLQYYDEGSAAWVDVEDAKNQVAGVDGSVLLTDTEFSSRLGGVSPVRYRARDEYGGASGECVTRNRHGIFVGVGTFGSDYRQVKELPDAPEQARKMHELVRGQEGFTNFHLLRNSEARYADVNRAFKAVAENVKNKPGDICIVYFSTHGGVYKDTTVGTLVLYDKPPVADDPERRGYHEGLLARHIRSLDPECKGVAVVCIISACHSGAFFDDSNEEMCRPMESWCHKEDLGGNVAWITAANASSSSVGLFDHFMIDYGWKHGWARKNSTQPENAISFYDLGRYAIYMYNPLAQKMRLSGGEKRNDDVLRHIVAGIVENEPNLALAAPSSPLDVQATQDRLDCVRVTWQQGPGGRPDWYCVLRNRADSDEYVGFETVDSSETSKDLPDLASPEHPMEYAVAACNGAGVAVSDVFAEGWRRVDLYQATFHYDLPGGYHFESGEESWVSPFIEDGQSLTPKIEEVTSRVDSWNLNGWRFIGWKNPTGTFVASKINGEWRYSSIIVHGDLVYHAAWTAMTQNWLDTHPETAAAANGDIATAAMMMAANGYRTVGECYALGINPDDPEDDLRITDFAVVDGKPVLTLNHTEDGSGNSFAEQVRTLGLAELGVAEEWEDVTDMDNPGADGYRFFRAEVEIP